MTKYSIHKRWKSDKNIFSEVTKGLDNELQKHCGVCQGDELYFNAPVIREVAIPIPLDHHANSVELVALQPANESLPPVTGIWKSADGEKEGLNESLEGGQYLREEVAYLIDKALGFNLVPLAYVTSVQNEDGSEEAGAAIWYVSGQTKRKPVDEYNELDIEHAAIIDYIMCQLDRKNKNYFTHPDYQDKVLLVDNGYSMPDDENYKPKSSFCSYMAGKELSTDALVAIELFIEDDATWIDIEDLVGGASSKNAMNRTYNLLQNKTIKESDIKK